MRWGSWTAIVVAWILAASSVGAQPLNTFYNGKTVRLLTSGGGGSYDTYARLLARYLPKHIHGGPTIIVQGMPGATIKVPLYLKTVVAGDNTVIAALNNAVAFAPLLGVPQADFDPMSFKWLGSPSTEIGLLVVWHAVPVNSIEDARKREVMLGVGSGGSSAAFFGRLLNTVLGTKLKLMSGYSGISSIYLAMERGEVEGAPAALWSDLRLSRPDWFSQKQAKALVQYGGEPIPELPGVPVARDLVKNEEDLKLLTVGMAPLEMGRPYTMPPNADDAYVTLMRAAVMATFRDPTFIEEAQKQRFEVDAVPKSGEDLLRIIKEVYDAPASVQERLKTLYQSE